MKKILFSNLFLLSTSLLITFLLIYITDREILTINFYENSGDPLAGLPSDDSGVYAELEKWIYVSSAIYLIVKLLFISMTVYLSLYLADRPRPFSKIFKIVIISDFLFFIPVIAKIMLFRYFYPNGGMTEWNSFYLFSALSLLKNSPQDWHYLLESMNFFEIAYWFLLALGISRVTKFDFDRSLRLVIFSYVPALIVWILTVTFCSIVLFPNMA